MQELPFVDPWHCVHSSEGTELSPLYVCVSGNSGSGKSTLLRLIATHIQGALGNTIAIDETSLHHPFIDRLFYDPATFSFEIQINFMMQRCILAKRWLQAGSNVVMERSHLEDLVFIRHLFAQNLVTRKEYETYSLLWKTMSGRVKAPDLIVFFDLSPDLALLRLNQAEESGRRPKEYPNEDMKRIWLASWQALYKERIMELQGAGTETKSVELVVLSGQEDEGQIPSAVLRIINRLIETRRNSERAKG